MQKNLLRKKWPNLSNFRHFRKKPFKENTDPAGQNSPNLVTLARRLESQSLFPLLTVVLLPNFKTIPLSMMTQRFFLVEFHEEQNGGDKWL
jgi:hypothetical protein